MAWFRTLFLFFNILFVIVYFIKQGHIFRPITPHRNGYNCELILPELYGAEDIQHHNNTLFISAWDRRGGLLKQRDHIKPGGIFIYDLANRAAGARLAPATKSVASHGISLYHDKKTNRLYLFAINHAARNDTVEVFEYDKATNDLKYLRTVYDPLFRNANDIYAVSPSAFYVTNDIGLGKNGDFLALIDQLLSLPSGSVTYWNGEKASRVSEYMFQPNGINGYDDLVFVTLTKIGHLAVFVRARNGTLTKINELALQSAVDNIDIEPLTRDLWIGSHPKPLNFLWHAATQSPAPSQVIRVSTDKKQSNKLNIEEIYMDDGSQISASSVAAIAGNSLKFYIGQVFDSGILECTKPV